MVIQSAKNLPQSSAIQPTFCHFIQKDLKRIFVKCFATIIIHLWKSRFEEWEVKLRPAEWEELPNAPMNWHIKDGNKAWVNQDDDTEGSWAPLLPRPHQIYNYTWSISL